MNAPHKQERPPWLTAAFLFAIDTSFTASYAQCMQVQISEERHAQLADYAQRHGKDPSEALDEVLADALEVDKREFDEALAGAREGYADFKAGRTVSLEEAFETLRLKHGLQR
jgi:predicted transcriptional regulator